MSILTISKALLLVCLTLFCFFTMQRVEFVSQERQQRATAAKSLFVEEDTEAQFHGRRLAVDTNSIVSNVPVNPFMSSMCADMTQDDSLVVSVTAVSVVIAAHNEDRAGLIKTVRYLFDFIAIVCLSVWLYILTL
jgi:hypothetical protein